MKRVVINSKYTYQTDLPVKIGDIVTLPSAHWMRDIRGDTWQGTVTSLHSDYDGPCSTIIAINTINKGETKKPKLHKKGK